MVLRRFLGLGEQPVAATSARAGRDADTETVRRIVAELQQLAPEQRRYLAGFAYVLARAAHADLDIAPNETRLMEDIVRTVGELPGSQAVLVVEIARHQSELYGGTEDYVVTREFAKHATPEQRRHVVEASFAVVAADHQITADEYTELSQIADELDLTREELNEIRRGYIDKLAAIQRMRGLSA